MTLRCLAVLFLILALGGCRSFSAVCREAAGGVDWAPVAAPEWAGSKLAELGWDRPGTTRWYFDGESRYRACRYSPGKGVPRCGGPSVAEYSSRGGEWTGGLRSIHVCH